MMHKNKFTLKKYMIPWTMMPPPSSYERREPWWNNVDMGKLLTRPLELSGKPTSSHLVAKQREVAKGTINLSLRIIFVHISKTYITCRKSLRHGADGLLFTSVK
jgi:hypothetical protein